MNANELAEIQAFKTEELTMWERNHTAAMLRQQQEEIKDLKQQVAFLEDWRDTWRPFLKAITGKVNEE
jgi:predicted esterase YcpF (UPF0227 family)